MAPNLQAKDGYTTFESTTGLVQELKSSTLCLKAKAIALGFLLAAVGAFFGLKGSQAWSESQKVINIADVSSYIEIGSGVCATSSHRMPYCQKNNLGPANCKAACDGDAHCTGYNPNTHKTYCFLFWNAGSPLSDTSWTNCYNEVQVGLMDGHDGTEGGMCYKKIQDVKYEMVFHGECDGAEIRMYEGNGDNEGTVYERLHNCAVACYSKMTPLSGSWTGFDVKGFVILESSSHTGRCYCESSNSNTCSRVANDYDRYDWSPSMSTVPLYTPIGSGYCDWHYQKIDNIESQCLRRGL